VTGQLTGQEHPLALAEKIVKIAGDADENTARVALEIARLLLAHREAEKVKFLSETLT
jgi:hypothetical protein